MKRSKPEAVRVRRSIEDDGQTRLRYYYEVLDRSIREAGLAVLRDDTLTRRGFRKGPASEATDVTTGDNAEKNTSQEEGIPRLQIQSKHFDYAFDHVLPSVSKKDQARYDRMRDRMARARSRGGGVSGEANADGDASKNDEQSKATGAEEAPESAK